MHKRLLRGVIDAVRRATMRHAPVRAATVAIASVAVLLTTASGQAQRQTFAVALPHGSVSCTAVADSTRVKVQALDGRELWQWSYARGSRYIAPAAMAVSQSCDTVALVGDAGYKYTWVVHKDGRAAAVSGSGTPLSAAFDPTGRRIGIGTAAGKVVLVGSDAKVAWTTSVSEYAPIVRGLRFTTEGHIVVTDGGAALVDLSGRVVWGRYGTGSALSGDNGRMVVWEQPNHGPGYGVVQFVDLTSRTELWPTPVYSSAPDALVSRDGNLIAVWMNRTQGTDPGTDFVPDPPMDLCILDMSGRVVRRVEAQRGRLLGGAADLSRLLIESAGGIVEVSAAGEARVVVDRETIGFDGVVAVADDYSGFVAGPRSAPGAVRWIPLR